MSDSDEIDDNISSYSSEDHLDEEDFELIVENTGRQIKKTKRFKRLQRRRISDDDNDSSSESQEELIRSSKKASLPLEAMFDEDSVISSKTKNISHNRYSDKYDNDDDDDDELYEEEDIANFIEDDLDEETEIEQRVNRLNKTGYQSKPTISQTRKSYRSERGHSSMTTFSDAWQEMNDIFGEGFDLEIGPDLQDDGLPMKNKNTSLEEIYEPAEIAAKLYTTEDEAIRVIDIPERIQLRDGRERPTTTETELRMESVYVAYKIEKLNRRPTSDEFRKNFLNAIAAVLKFIREDFFEIPFIAAHRKEYFQAFLTLDDLWAIYDIDEKWNKLQDRKAKILSFFENRKDQSVIDETHLIHFLNKAELDEEDLDDCMDYIHYKYGKDSFQMSSIPINDSKSIIATTFKRPVSSMRRIEGKSELSSKSPILKEFLSKIGISPRQFGINMTDMVRRFEPEDATISPQTLIQSLVTVNNPSAETIKDNALALLGKEFSMEPFIRKAFMKILENSVFISTTPTEKGIYEINSTHEFAHIKFLHRKPMNAFVDAEYIELLEAEKNNLLIVAFDVDLEEKYYLQLESFFMSESYSLNSDKWNPFRKQILKECIANHIINYAKKKFSERMKKSALDFIGKFCQHSLTEKLLFGKYKENNSTSFLLNKNEAISDTKLYLAVSWGDGIPGSVTFAIVINEEGTVLDQLRLANMLDRNKKIGDLESLSDFIRKYKPCVIGVSGTHPNTKYSLLPEIQKLVDELRFSGNVDENCIPQVIIADNDTALIYQHSKAAAEEFPLHPSLFYFTVSLARRLLEPLCEFAKLANFENSILDLPLHPYQSSLNAIELRTKYIDRALVNVINLVGVDINRALRFSFFNPLLQFLSGLGPRKAQLLYKTITKTMTSGYLERRSDLLRMGMLGKRVFLNCASFVKIDPKYLPKRRQFEVDILDSTRIHPESYDLARKIAADALEIEEPLDDDQNPSLHIEELMNQPEKLNDLLLDEYAKELEKTQRAKKSVTLKDITTELQAPFHDRRTYQPCSIERIFEIVTGETDRSIFPGLVVSAEVTRIGEKFVNVRLSDNSLMGSISIRSLADYFVKRVEDVISPRQTVLCKILSINKERCAVELSMKPSDISANINSRPLDTYYDTQKESSFMSFHKSNNESSSGTMMSSSTIPSIIGTAAYRAVLSSKPGSRSISHPLFKNVNRIKVENMLADGADGDIIIRPSSKGFDYIVVSWRLALDVYQHIEVREEKKDTPWTLGHALFIGEQKYEDLDEIIARYVDPLISYYREVASHTKYLSSTTGKKDVELQLRKLKAQQPKRIIYAMSMIPEQPCNFLLSFLPFESTYHEIFSITNNGLVFRNKNFDSVDELLNFFKQDHMAKHQQEKGLNK